MGEGKGFGRELSRTVGVIIKPLIHIYLSEMDMSKSVRHPLPTPSRQGRGELKKS
ncbi:MAG: hypothetical protein Q6354_01885 [Candidatus Brocadiales bacterium]|nr:hypothetical protein [Candidatus Brocadiales bacterium]